MVEKTFVFVQEWSKTQHMPPLPEMRTEGDGVFYWSNTGTKVDWDELVRLGYYEEREQCPKCNGSGILPKKEK